MIQSDPKPKWWTELAWQLYERLPSSVVDTLGPYRPYALPCYNLRIPVAILRSPTRKNGRPGTLLIAGDERRIDYLILRFFEGEYQRESVGTVPLWNLARTLKRLRPSADLTIARVDRLSARLFFGMDYLAVPEWVGSTLTVPDELGRLARKNHSLKDDLRIVHRNKLRSDFTQETKDFELFYYKMYVPFIRNRHGEQAVIRNVYVMRRMFRQGGLLWVRQNGQPIAGGIFHLRDQVLKLLVVGAVNGDLALLKAGALTALYLFIINHAKELGCKLVDFGGVRPSLNDGVLRYKRKWGMKLIDKQNNYYDFLVHWNHFNSSVISFLSNTPLIFRDHGGLSALYLVDKNEPATKTEVEEIHRSMWIPGLQRLYIVSISGWQPGVSNPPQTHLVDATTVEDCDPGRLIK